MRRVKGCEWRAAPLAALLLLLLAPPLYFLKRKTERNQGKLAK